jgi:hypothetical protein
MSLQGEIPDVWKKVGMWFHQDFFICFPDPYDGILAFWNTISKTERTELLELLLYLNDANCVGGIPKKYWKLSGAQVTPANIKEFLKELQVKFETF